MSFVIDASIAAAWLLPDEENQTAERALSLLETDDAYVPDLFWHEMRNILIMAERRKRIGNDDVLACLMRLSRLPILTVASEDHLSIIRLASKHQLSAYDAAYLSLAIAQGAALVTADTRLRKAAQDENVAGLIG